jgi:hypothetical protein
MKTGDIRTVNAEPSAAVKVALYYVVSTLLLFLGFFTNYWRVADQQWFESQNYDMESFVIGRVVKSRQDGVFSVGGLTGMGSPDASSAEFGVEAFDFQRRAYLDGLAFGSFSAYKSQIGGQGMLFSILDGLMHLPAHEELRIFYAFTSILSSLTLSVIVLWFYWEVSFSASLFALASALLSPWLVVFGGKLWWSMWSFYLPMAVVMYYLKSRPAHRHRRFGLLVFTAVFAKCVFTGYEYITTTLIMVMVPFVYYGMRDRWSFRELKRGLLTVVFSSSLAVLLSLAILCIQIASVEGSILEGADHIWYSLQKRTVADTRDWELDHDAGLELNVVSVVGEYLTGTYFNVGDYSETSKPFAGRFVSQIRYWHLVCLFGIVSVFLHALRRRHPDEEKPQSDMAFVSATWFSVLAPLSWFAIFMSHSYVHTHMDFIVWQMPFTLFGFALCGLVLSRTLDPGFRNP